VQLAPRHWLPRSTGEWQTCVSAALVAVLLAISGLAVFRTVVGVSPAQRYRPLLAIGNETLGPALLLFSGATCGLALIQARRGRLATAAPSLWESAIWGLLSAGICIVHGQPQIALAATLVLLAAAVFEPRPRQRRRIIRLGRELVTFSAGLGLLLPLLWLLAGSLRIPGTPQPGSGAWWSPSAALASYARLGQLIPLGRELRNSMLIVALGVPLALLVAASAGFALAHLPARWRRPFLALSLVGLAIPPMALWLTRLLMYRWLGVLNTPIVLLAPALLGGSPLCVLVLYLAFRRIPAELWDQARLDGADPLAMWWRIGLPLVRGPLIALGALVFGLFWGDYTDPLLYLSDGTWQTLPVGLHALQQMNPSQWAVLLAGAVVMTLPAILVFALAQRAITSAVAASLHTEKESHIMSGRSSIILILLRSFVLLLALALTACGAHVGTGPAEPPTTGVPPGTAIPAAHHAPQAESHIRFQFYGDAEERAVYEQLVTQYMATHPGRTVEMTYVPAQDDEPGQDDHTLKLQAAFTAGSPPDVFLLNYRRQAQFATSGALLPVGPLLASSGVDAGQYYPAALDAFRTNGQLQCMPQNISSLVVFYNKDLFTKYHVTLPTAGWTWEQFLNAARQLTIDTNRDGKPDIYGLSTEPIVMRLAPFIWQSGGDLVDQPAKPARLTLDAPRARKAIDFFLNLSNVYGVVPSEDEATAQNDYTRFTAGKLGMVLYSQRVVPAFRGIKDFTWDVAPLPVGDRAATVLHSQGYCIAAQTQEKDAAWDFVRYATGPEGQRLAARSGAMVPSLTAVAESADFLDPSRAPASSKVFLDVIPTIRALPTTPNWGAVEQSVGEELEKAFFANSEANEALGAAQAEVEGGMRPISLAAKKVIAAALEQANEEGSENLVR